MSLGFHRPSTVTEALTLQAELGAGALFLAGGSEINQKHFPGQPDHLISLAGLDLAGVASTEAGLLIGATTSFQQLLDSPDLPAPLREAAARLVNRNVRNVATVGGHVATGKSCADLLPCLVALEARVMLSTLRGSAVLSVPEYLASRPEGLIVAVELPLPVRACAVTNFTRTANDLSVLTAAASLAREGDAVSAPILAMGGVAPTVVRLDAVEQALAGVPLPDRASLEALVAAAIQPIDDKRGTAAFKRKVGASLAADVILAAWAAAEVM
jgi:putative selenate reductase FAD-binding subunit